MKINAHDALKAPYRGPDYHPPSAEAIAEELAALPLLSEAQRRGPSVPFIRLSMRAQEAALRGESWDTALPWVTEELGRMVKSAHARRLVAVCFPAVVWTEPDFIRVTTGAIQQTFLQARLWVLGAPDSCPPSWSWQY